QDSGSVGASLHRGWITLASSVSHGDARAIVASCEAGEGAARASYEEVLSSGISGNTRALIETQWKAIERAQQEMQHLQNQYGRGSAPGEGLISRAHFRPHSSGPTAPAQTPPEPHE